MYNVDETIGTSVSSPILGREKEMVQNAGGGQSFQVTFRTLVLRFLIMGTVSGRMDTRDRVTLQDMQPLLNHLKDEEKAFTALSIVRQVSMEGRAPKKDATIMLYAALLTPGLTPSIDVRKEAAEMVSNVIRTATQLYQLARYFGETGRGGGCLYKRTFNNWWGEKDNLSLAYQIIKYRQREGWTMADLYSLVRPKYELPEDSKLSDGVNREELVKFYADRNLLASYSVRPEKTDMAEVARVYPQIGGYEELKQPGVTVEHVAETVETLGLTWEMIPTQFLNEVAVWKVLVRDMPMMAMVRNLSRLSRIDAFADTEILDRVVAQLTDENQVRRSRVHPMNMYVARKTYMAGKSSKGSSTWTPHPRIAEALEVTIALAFGNVEATNQNLMICLDLSGSMYWPEARTSMDIYSGEASAMMSYVTQTVEPEGNVDVVGFHWSWRKAGEKESDLEKAGLCDVRKQPGQSIDQYERMLYNKSGGGTNIAAPIIYALRHKKKYDAFVIYTDNDVNSSVHPVQALKQYREEMNASAKLLVVACAGTKYSVADPNDTGMLDINGLDASCPDIISKFLNGTLLDLQ